jgi:hypothetical protein
MVKLLNVQRRLFLFVVTILFTFLIRLVSFSFGGIHRKRGNQVTISNRGQFKQVAFRFTRRNSNGALRLPVTLAADPEIGGTSYLLRVSNFHPFVRVENLGLYAATGTIAAASLVTNRGYEGMYFQCDGDGDGDGDGGDGDGGCDGDECQ